MVGTGWEPVGTARFNASLAAAIVRLVQGFPPRTSSFVGRADEMAQLVAAWEQAKCGHGGIVFISGDGGIGKTRLAEELAAMAAEVPANVIWGRCYEGEGALGLWPWMQVVRELSCLVSPEPMNPWLDRLRPDQADGMEDGSPIAGSEDRFRLALAVNQLIAASATKPLLIILDDLHWADEGSLRLLEFVCIQGCLRDHAVLVVATYREGEPDGNIPLRDSLVRLKRGPVAANIRVSGLSPAETAQLVAELAGSLPDDNVLRVLQSHTEGNPFVLGETVRAAEGAPLTVANVEGLPWRAGLLGPVSLRLSRLDQSTRTVVECAAVLGREFSTALLGAVSGLEAGPLLHQLDVAEEAGIVQPLPTVPGRYRFVHALLRESLYGELLAGKRQRLHFRAAEALEQIARYDLEDSLPELVRHFVHGAALGGADRAVAYSLRLGERSIRQYAYESAETVYKQAYAIRQSWPGPPVERAELQLGIGESLRRQGRADEARAAYLHAAEIGRALHSDRDVHGAVVLGRAALGLVRARFGFSEPATVALLEEALDALAGVETPLVAMLNASLALAVGFGDRRDEARVRVRDALKLARKQGDRWALGMALDAAHSLLSSHRDLDERLVLANELLSLGEQEFAILGRRWLVCDQLELGDWDGARRQIALHDALAATTKQPMHLWYSALFAAMAVTASGRLADAETAASAALVAGQQTGSSDTVQFFAPVMLFIRREQGRGSEMEPLLVGMENAPFQVPAWRPALAMLRADAGKLEEARSVFDSLMSDDCAAFPDDNYWLTSMYLMTETCVALGDERAAQTLRRLLGPFRRRMVEVGNGALVTAPVSYLLGRLALLVGDDEEAAALFTEAVATAELWGASAMLAHALFGLSCALREANPARSAEARATAAALADEFGLVRLQNEMGTGAPVATAGPAPLAAPGGLSPREAEVLALLADGCSNRAIAEALVLSMNTVIRHVSNIYRKIGAANRSEATAWALRNDIRSPLDRSG